MVRLRNRCTSTSWASVAAAAPLSILIHAAGRFAPCGRARSMVQALWTLGPWPGGHLRETLRDSSSMRTAWLPAADRQARDSAETLMHKREPPRRSISQPASSMTSPARWLRSRAACRSSTTIDAQAESASSNTLNRLASLRPKVPAGRIVAVSHALWGTAAVGLMRARTVPVRHCAGSVTPGCSTPGRCPS